MVPRRLRIAPIGANIRILHFPPEQTIGHFGSRRDTRLAQHGRKPMEACRDILRREDNARKSLDDQQGRVLIDPAGQLTIFIKVNTMKRLCQRGRKSCGLNSRAVQIEIV
jgi:hypothetical protein